MRQTGPRRQHRRCWQSQRAARKRPRVAVAPGGICLMAMLAVMVGCDRWQRQDTPRGPAKPHGGLARFSASDKDSVQKLRLAAQNLEEHPTPLSAKIRETVHVLGHQMVGSGEYCQMPNPDEAGFVRLLSRMDLRLQIHERTATWKQICDGKAIWTDRKVPDDEKTATRNDGEPGYSTLLERVLLEEVEQAKVWPHESGQPLAVSLSGLPQIIRTLAGSFDFAPPRIVQFGRATVWLLEGRWNAAALGDLVPGQRTALASGDIDRKTLAARVPDRVRIYLGKDRTGPWLGDLAAARGPFPDLFPFRIEYGRQSADGDVHDLLSLEVFDVDVNDGNLPPQKFTFASRRQPKNATARFVQALRREQAQRTER
jgi:hypothetical protein